LQVWSVVADLGTCALVVVSIERFLYPFDEKRRLLFWVVFVSECFWGLVSGMKSGFLQNFLVVALVSSLIQRKLRKAWIVAAVVGLIVIYPTSDRYRSLVRHAGGITSIAAATRLGSEAFSESGQGESGLWGHLSTGSRNAVARLDLLQNLGLALSMGQSTAGLQGAERWWMLPFYPFIPRFLWPSKPILDKARSFSVALGFGDQTATGITYLGDLYVSYGVPGILIGMFLWGVVGQWLTNYVSGILDKRRIFLYSSIFLSATNLEIDAFSFWSGLIKSLTILSGLAWVIYGPRGRTSRALLASHTAISQP